jgi:hypothetical protein
VRKIALTGFLVLCFFAPAYGNQDIMDAIKTAEASDDWSPVRKLVKTYRLAGTLNFDFTGEDELSIRDRLLQAGQLDLLVMEDEAPSVIEENNESLVVVPLEEDTIVPFDQLAAPERRRAGAIVVPVAPRLLQIYGSKDGSSASFFK